MTEKVQLLKDAKKTLYPGSPDSGDFPLLSPVQKRAEIRNIKKSLQEFNQFKQNHILLGRRDRTMKGGWRHGVTGVDNADADGTSVFYRDAKQDRDHW